jgi:hypothetical protein
LYTLLLQISRGGNESRLLRMLTLKNVLALLESDGNITELHLAPSNTGPVKSMLTDADAVGLAHKLACNQKILTLDLYGNRIGNEGVAALSASLRPSVTALGFSTNCIGDTGAMSLAGVIKSNSTLTELNLNCNCIGDIGAVSLAQGLESNSVMMALYLNHNSITSKGAKAFIHMLQRNGSLAQLGLQGNGVSAHDMAQVDKLLRAGRQRVLQPQADVLEVLCTTPGRSSPYSHPSTRSMKKRTGSPHLHDQQGLYDDPRSNQLFGFANYPDAGGQPAKLYNSDLSQSPIPSQGQEHGGSWDHGQLALSHAQHPLSVADMFTLGVHLNQVGSHPYGVCS